MPSKQNSNPMTELSKKISDAYNKPVRASRLIATAFESSGIKHDKEKRQWALLPWREVGVVVDVLTHGCKKYSADNWMHVLGAERRYFEAALRHITARRAGEIHDKESKLPHLAHAVCCILFWMWFDTKNRKGHK